MSFSGCKRVEVGQGCTEQAGFVHKRILSAVKKLEFVSDGKSKCRRRDIIVVNVHAPKEDKIDDIKDRFYGEYKMYSMKSLNTERKFC